MVRPDVDSQTSKQASNIGLLQSRQPWRPTHTWSLSVWSTVSVANFLIVANCLLNSAMHATGGCGTARLKSLPLRLSFPAQRLLRLAARSPGPVPPPQRNEEKPLCWMAVNP